MKDDRKDKREKEFINSQPSFELIKKQRENFMISLRKKNKQDLFMKNRKDRFRLGVSDNGEDDKFDNDEGISKILEELGLSDTPNEQRFMEVFKMFKTNENIQTRILGIKIFVDLAWWGNGSKEYIDTIEKLYEPPTFKFYFMYLTDKNTEQEILNLLINLSLTDDNSFFDCLEDNGIYTVLLNMLYEVKLDNTTKICSIFKNIAIGDSTSMLDYQIIDKLVQFLKVLNSSSLDDDEYNKHLKPFLYGIMYITEEIASQYWYQTIDYFDEIRKVVATRFVDDTNRYLALVIISAVTSIDDFFIDIIFSSPDGKIAKFKIIIFDGSIWIGFGS